MGSNSQIQYLATVSNAALAPYLNRSDFLLSIPNKVLDYLSFGCPIVTPLKGEVGRLVKRYQIGLSYEEGDSMSLFNALNQMHLDRKSCLRYGYNARKLYMRNFNSKFIYNDFVKRLKSISKL